jgi:hypothetical protein
MPPLTNELAEAPGRPKVMTRFAAINRPRDQLRGLKKPLATGRVSKAHSMRLDALAMPIAPPILHSATMN